MYSYLVPGTWYCVHYRFIVFSIHTSSWYQVPGAPSLYKVLEYLEYTPIFADLPFYYGTILRQNMGQTGQKKTKYLGTRYWEQYQGTYLVPGNWYLVTEHMNELLYLVPGTQ